MAQDIGKSIRQLLERLFQYIVFKLTPQKSLSGDDNYIFDRFWKDHPSIPEAVPYIVPELWRAICLHTIKGMYLKMSLAQACILFLFFANGEFLTREMIAVLLLTYGGLLVNEAYIVKKERLEGEVITTVLTPVLIVLSFAAVHLTYGIFGWGPPNLMPVEALIPRIVWLSMLIGVVRYYLGDEPKPGHPYQGLLDLHASQWYFNLIWLAGALACMLTSELAMPTKSFFQGFFTNAPGVMFFTNSIRLQLNPIGGRYRHSVMGLGLFQDPYEEEIKMKRDYLLVGADWLHNFTLQSLLEILGFAFASSPFFVGLYQWYVGDPNAARFNWFEVGINVSGWIVLIATWPYVKKRNRQTYAVFDQVAQRLASASKNSLLRISQFQRHV